MDYLFSIPYTPHSGGRHGGMRGSTKKEWCGRHTLTPQDPAERLPCLDPKSDNARGSGTCRRPSQGHDHVAPTPGSENRRATCTRLESAVHNTEPDRAEEASIVESSHMESGLC